MMICKGVYTYALPVLAFLQLEKDRTDGDKPYSEYVVCVTSRENGVTSCTLYTHTAV